MVFCNSDAAVDVDPDVRRVKEGDFLKYKPGFFSSKWIKMHGVLYSDSRLAWFEEKNDRKPKGSVLLKDVIPYICVGQMTDKMPTKRPSVADGNSVHHLVGIGMDPKAETVHWIQFSSDVDIESWFKEITKTLPQPPSAPVEQGSSQQPQPQPQSQPKPQNQNGIASNQHLMPPPQNSNQSKQYPAQPPPRYNNSQPQNTHTTVVVNSNQNNYDDGGFGTGLLAGSLLGYGMGSMWGGHGMFYGGPMIGGYGVPMMGGAFVSENNDTNITNNYYNGTPENGGEQVGETQEQNDNVEPEQEPEPEPEQDIENGGYEDGVGYGEDYGNDMNYGGEESGPGYNENYNMGEYGGEQYGGEYQGDYGGDFEGGGDYGGDFGGGDYGGDFGGGDF
ncbi:unnamed protein product [Caenorhabditis angaria]|uniref:PH domain-containing protein n=1 Tax=Caenorhabditis angaria TaxID=860376 RepID=A0A9P1IYA5_9PELO|nr:unnamed protein product [Caenorhabditis angaria]